MRIRSYKDLIAWQRGIDLAVACYGCTRLFPIHERYCLTQQIQRAAISVPANIAEGQGRYTDPNSFIISPIPADQCRKWRRFSQ
jgi:hypothetical protein